MKIRSGFVSNSSSCSFCLYGIYLSDSDIKKIKEDLQTKDVEGLFNDNGLETESGSEYCDGLYVGRSWKNIKGDQTGNQFMKEIEDSLQTILKDVLPVSCDTYEEAWYNG